MNETKKMSIGLKILFVVLAIAVLLLMAGVSIYNSLVNAEKSVQNSIANIDVQLQRRNDLIPSLVSSVKASASHEEKAIAAVIDARARMMEANNIDEKIAADDDLSGAIRQLNLIVESYPDLKANQGFLALQDELAGTESSIGASRKDYNDTVMDYNRKLRSFPSSLVAGVFGFEKYNAFTASPESSKSIDAGGLPNG